MKEDATEETYVLLCWPVMTYATEEAAKRALIAKEKDGSIFKVVSAKDYKFLPARVEEVRG